VIQITEDKASHAAYGSFDQELSKEISRLSSLREAISDEKISDRKVCVLIAVILANIIIVWYNMPGYPYLWVAASLYFYLFYPMLPLALFPLRILHQKITGQVPIPKADKSLLKWAKELKIFSNKRTGYQLFMRFFLLSIIPITYGVFFIYGLSVLFTIIIALTSDFSSETLVLLLVQCLGIVFFYGEVFIYRGRMLYNTQLRLKKRFISQRRIILYTIIGTALLCISTILVILMIVAMLMPAITLTKYVNMLAFSSAGRNLIILIILVSQFVIMQYLQSLLSHKLALTMVSGFADQLKEISTSAIEKELGIKKKAENLLLESRLYAYNRRQMFGLYPTYSIGVNIPVLLSIKDLKSLQEIFFGSPDDTSGSDGY